MFFASPLQPILSSFAPMRPERSAGPGPAQARYRWLFSAGHTQELPGSWKIHPVPLPRSRIPASSSDLTLSVQQCRPHFADSEGTGFTDLSRLNHAASVPAAYASSGALPHPHAGEASGWWLALAGRDSVGIDVRRMRIDGYGGYSGGFPTGLNPAPITRTTPQAPRFIPVSRISQGPVGDQDFPSRPSRARAGLSPHRHTPIPLTVCLTARYVCQRTLIRLKVRRG
jgi:hypothetical protein